VADAGQARVNAFVETQLDQLSASLEKRLDADVMAIVGPIMYGAEERVRIACESRNEKRPRLAVVLSTDGGVIEVVERMVLAIRYHWPKEVVIIIPDRAMSAGTVFAMSGDSIMMDYFACLGPIDPQIERDGRLIPALSYLVQYERLKQRAADGEITTAELALLQNLDLAELHSFEEAKELSHELLKQWLTKYKFKDWNKTETAGKPVTPEMKESRALDIASKLSDHQRWHSHGRPISKEVLYRDLKLKIDDFGEDADLSRDIKHYYQFLSDYMIKIGAYHQVHTHGCCLLTPDWRQP
jgi:hypothetical protein